MASKNAYLGACVLCGLELKKSGATRHVSTCPARTSGRGSVFHLVVESAEYRDFWLHLHVKTTAKLSTLDAFLRETWLECCGHLSAFEIAGERYESMVDPSWGTGSRRMSFPLSSIVSKGTTFRYEYDYGSTTPLTVRCVGTVEGVLARPEVTLLARNHVPDLRCDECGDRATWLGDVALCQPCAGVEDPEDCWEEGLLPVVNSPRMGVCGYAG